MTKSSPTPPLLTVRTLVILLLGLLFGALAGTLTYLSTRTSLHATALPTAALAGLTAASGAVMFLHKAIS